MPGMAPLNDSKSFQTDIRTKAQVRASNKALGVSPDPEWSSVAAAFRALDPFGNRTAKVLRNTIDQLYDGQRTGRYRWDQLFKTEKTRCGTLVEINLHREFAFEDGIEVDYRVAGSEVGCEYSQKIGGWMIPPEARGKLCVVASAEDGPAPTWCMGLVRAREEFLNTGSNRDAKATLNGDGRNAIEWLFKNHPLPPNVLLQIDPAVVEKIFLLPSGQKRINALFRAAQGMVVGRAAIATVAMQDEYMKRVRENGGARSALRPEGILILGQYKSHVEIAKALGVPVPGPGDSVSVRVVPASGKGPGTAKIGKGYWRVADAQSPIVPAPELPKI